MGAARPRLRAVLGEGVEQLVYLFQSANQCRRVTPRRDGLWDAPLGESFFLPGVLQGQPEWVRCPAALRAPLLTLFWANDLDQEGFPSDDRQLDYAIDVLVTSWSVLPLLSAGAAEWVQSLRRRVARAPPTPFERLPWTRERRSLLREARRPSERDFHRARLEAYRANYEALLADLGGRSIKRSSCGADTRTRHDGRHDHGPGEALKRRR